MSEFDYNLQYGDHHSQRLVSVAICPPPEEELAAEIFDFIEAGLQKNHLTGTCLDPCTETDWPGSPPHTIFSYENFQGDIRDVALLVRAFLEQRGHTAHFDDRLQKIWPKLGIGVGFFFAHPSKDANS